MCVELNSGEVFSLKDSTGNIFKIGFGWEIAERTILGFGEFDINISALLLQDGKLISTEDIISYKHVNHKSSTIRLRGVNDKQYIIFKKDLIPIEYDAVVFYATIHNGVRGMRDFYKVENIHVKVSNSEDTDMMSFTVPKLKPNKDNCTMILGKVVRNKESWVFTGSGAINNRASWDFIGSGETHQSDDLLAIADTYK